MTFEKFKTYEIEYYKKGTGLHEPKRTVMEADTKQEAFDDFKHSFPSTTVLGIKRVKVVECFSDSIC